ncbi:MAG: YraN family protein [Campylobacterota bacterium]|nr:YraN family protein [Campylobacterota bacterium]
MSRAKGNIAEQKACQFLYDNGFTIIQQNFYSRFGEIDIIAVKDEVLHFIEVKSGDDYEKAIQNITKTKLSRVIKTGDVYIKKSSYNGDYEYDAIVIASGDIWHIENITI